VTVASLDRVEAALRSGGLAFRRAGDGLIAPFPEELGKGAWLFSERSNTTVFS
jgi:hypothetical protein